MNVTFSSSKKNLLTLIAMSMLAVACSNIEKTSTDDTKKLTDDTKKQSQSIVSKVSDKKVVEELQQNLKKSGIEAKILSAKSTAMEGVYWVTADGIPSFFADRQGKYILQGKLIEVGGATPVDISAKLSAEDAKKKLATVDKKDMIIYPAKGKTRASIYVFTDSTCPYCQKFHHNIPEINKKGIEVRYLAWPRHAKAKTILENVWCSDDRQKAMDKAKNGEIPTAKSCDNPVQAQSDLGFAIGVSGTPAIYSEEGEQIGGYVPLENIEEALGLEKQ